MQNQRLPAVPLVTNDPYFSLWSPADRLYDAPVCHWTGEPLPVDGVITVDGVPYRFMGKGMEAVFTQEGLLVTPLTTRYTFAHAGVRMTLCFTTPLLPDDLDLLSAPITYVDWSVVSTDGRPHDAAWTLTLDEALTHRGMDAMPMIGDVHRLPGCLSAWMSKRQQTPLGHSGDHLTTDWGYLYATVEEGCGQAAFMPGERARLRVSFEAYVGDTPVTRFCVLSYDDLLSIFYFGQARRGYWTRGGRSILDLNAYAVRAHEDVLARCAAFDGRLLADARETGGEAYAEICSAAYRQCVGAHKLIEDAQGQPVFLSKECHSNGCVGTVDISYPSAPLFLLYQPELVLGMLRPVFAFARMPVWPFDFAPHDVGRYPYVTGQVYGAWPEKEERRVEDGEVFPMLYMYPANAGVYVERSQMPVEECGNMLILAAAVARRKGTAEDFAPHMDLLAQWVRYLEAYGEDPGEQLCTDDFAGHLAHNANLSAKAILGLEAYSILLGMSARREEAAMYHEKAGRMAESWRARAVDGDHTVLTFTPKTGWSLKYNLVWDLLFESGLFPEALLENETRHYLREANRYGTPLDSRETYTKSDWLLWAASLTGDADRFAALIEPVRRYLRESPDRVPFSDIYYTHTGVHRIMQGRPVQGGVFMPLLKRRALLRP